LKVLARALECQGKSPKFNTRALFRRALPFGEIMSNTVLHATDADFDSQVLASDQPVLVDFWAPWCGPCKMIAPSLDQLAVEYAGKAKIVKVDVDQNQQTAMKYHVRSIPMLLVFKNGQVQNTQIGAVGKAQLAQLIDKAL
jgi:thioredoxin 1